MDSHNKLKMLITQDRPHQQTRPKSSSLYNLKDFLPTSESYITNKHQTFTNNSITLNPFFKQDPLITTLSQFKILKAKEDHSLSMYKNITYQSQQLQRQNDTITKKYEELKENNQNLKSMLAERDSEIKRLKEQLSNTNNQIRKMKENQQKVESIKYKPRPLQLWSLKVSSTVEPLRKQLYCIQIQTDQISKRQVAIQANCKIEQSPKIIYEIPYKKTHTYNPSGLIHKELMKQYTWKGQKMDEWKGLTYQKQNVNRGNGEEIKKSWKNQIKREQLDIYPIKQQNISQVIKILMM